MVCVRVPATLCARCKGRKRLCGVPTCPFIQRFYAQVNALAKVRDLRVDGSTPPSALVGEKGYPNVPVFLLVPPGVYGDEARIYDAPTQWWGQLDLDSIVRLRSSMVAGFSRLNVEKGVELLRSTEILYAALSTKPVDSEVTLAKMPSPRLAFSDRAKPIPPSAPAKKILISSNPRIDRDLDRFLEDDVPAQKAIVELYRRGVDLYLIQRALSLGGLGRARHRKLVPTRWAITAVDRTISRYLLSTIWGESSTVNQSMVFFSEYLGNRFWILLEPGKYEVRWVEVWHPSTIYTQRASDVVVVYNRERISGTLDYLDGGFEAAKLPVLEFLARERKQCKVLILREILPQYYAPVGNWHIRESVRNALARGPVAKGVTTREFIDIVRSVSETAAQVAEEYISRLSKVKLLDFFVTR